MEQGTVSEVVKPNALAFQVAIIFALYTILLIFILNLAGIGSQVEGVATWEKIVSYVFSYGTFIVAILYTQNKYKAMLGGEITFKQAFSSGFKTASYAGLFIGILSIIYFKFIDPNSFDELMDVQIKALGNDENAIKGFETMRGSMVYMMAFGSAVTYTILGLVISLATSAIVKNKSVD